MVFCGFGVERNLCFQRLEIRKTGFVANFMYEADIQVCAGDVPGRDEQGDIQERTGDLVGARTDAEGGDGLVRTIGN